MNDQVSTIDYEYLNFMVNLARLGAMLIVVFLGAWLGHRYWIKQKEIENELRRKHMKFSSRAESCKAVWALLEFLSEKEYPKTIIVTRGTPEKPIRYCRLDRAKEFIQEVPKVLYTGGHGAFMTNGVEDNLMDLREKFYTFIESTLWKDAKKEETFDASLFSSLEGFYKMIEDREEQLVRIKNPKFSEGVYEKTQILRDFLLNQLQNG